MLLHLASIKTHYVPELLIFLPRSSEITGYHTQLQAHSKVNEILPKAASLG